MVLSSVDHTTVGGSDQHIPLLREVYEQFPETPINIDIKVNSDELIRKVSWQITLLIIIYERLAALLA